MKHIFILGRNPELSKKEILCYLNKEEIKVFGQRQIKNALLIETEKEISKMINYLGGTIAVGKVLCEADSENLEKETLYSGANNKVSYAVWNFSEDNSYNKTSQYLRRRFRSEKLKATEKPLTGSLELQDGKTIRISSGLINEEYFVFDNLFGKIIERTNYKSLEFRDMKKPQRRESLAISPRLAKIMINLSKVKKQETLLDCFCGIGVILQEALLQDIKVIGIDNDKDAIIGARKNLEWMKFKNYELINSDSRKVKINSANVLVAEPDLGEILRKIPTKEQAQKILNNYEKLMISVLNNLKNYVKGRFVFTAPLIKLINKKRIGCDIQNILRKTHLRIVDNFPEFRKNQIVGREIFVLEKF